MNMTNKWKFSKMLDISSYIVFSCYMIVHFQLYVVGHSKGFNMEICFLWNIYIQICQMHFVASMKILFTHITKYIFVLVCLQKLWKRI